MSIAKRQHDDPKAATSLSRLRHDARNRAEPVTGGPKSSYCRMLETRAGRSIKWDNS